RRVISVLLDEKAANSPNAPPNGEHILLNRYLAGKFVPLNPGELYHLVLKQGARDKDINDGLPVPPRELWEGYGLNEQEYLQSGRRHMLTMQEILTRAGSTGDDLNRVLELG